MPSAFTNVGGIRQGPSITPYNIFATRDFNVPAYITSSIIIDGNATRDTGHIGAVTLLRPGLLLGKETAAPNKYANSVYGLTSVAYGGNQTTINVNPAVATEIVRRAGSSTSGTFNVTGPAVTGGTVRTLLATYSAVNTTTGAITVTALATAVVNAVNQIEAFPFVDAGGAGTSGTASGTFSVTIEGITTPAITYSVTVATTVTNVQAQLDATFGTNAIVFSGASRAAYILTFSGTGYSGRPITGHATAIILTGTGLTIAPSTTTTLGVTAVAAQSGEMVIGSLVQPVDGSQTVLTILSDGVFSVEDTTDLTGANQDNTLNRYLSKGDLHATKIICLTADDFGTNTEPACTKYLKAALNSNGNTYSFSDDR